MLSYQEMALPQEGQRDDGHMIDSCRGRRWIHTFKKLPIIVPKRNTMRREGSIDTTACTTLRRNARPFFGEGVALPLRDHTMSRFGISPIYFPQTLLLQLLTCFSLWHKFLPRSSGSSHQAKERMFMARTTPAKVTRSRSNSSATSLPPRRKRPEALTSREREILQLIWTGCKNKEVAQRLKISVKTVEAHRANMMKKVRVSNTAQLLKAAIQEGMIAIR